jgi:hypothetical protein
MWRAREGELSTETWRREYFAMNLTQTEWVGGWVGVDWVNLA